MSLTGCISCTTQLQKSWVNLSLNLAYRTTLKSDAAVSTEDLKAQETSLIGEFLPPSPYLRGVARKIESTAQKSLSSTFKPLRKDGEKQTLTEVFLAAPISVFRSVEAAMKKNKVEPLWSYGDYITWRHDLWIDQTGYEQADEWLSWCQRESMENKQSIPEVKQEAKRNFYSQLPDPPDSLPYFSFSWR